MNSQKALLTYSTPLGIIYGYITHSNSLEILAEIELSNLQLPLHMNISECRIFKWLIKATDNCSAFKVICELEPNFKIDGGPSSGEHLDAQTWESESYVLSLGTDDGEYLNSRANKNIIPNRFVTKHPDGLNWVNYVNNGMEIKIPELKKGETIELRFSIAWKNNELNKDDISTWYAVDSAIH